MKKTLFGFWALALIAMLTLNGCGGTELEKGTLVESRKALDELEKDSTNYGKRFAVEGYLHIGSSLHVRSGEPTSVMVYSKPEGEGKSMGSISLTYGAGYKNSFTVPTQFDDTDITFTDHEGKKHAYDQKAIYSFTLTTEPEQKFNSETKEWYETGKLNFSHTNVRIDVVTDSIAVGENTAKAE